MHWPIAFLSLGYGLDLLYGATTYLKVPYLVNTFAYSMPDIGKASYYLHVLGVLTTIPSAATGAAQLKKIYANGGLYEADGQTMRKKMKIGLIHAAMNDMVLVAGVWTWWSRHTENYAVPGAMNIFVSMLMLPALLWSANLGGTMVYNYGAGLNIGKVAKKSQKGMD